MPKIHPPKYRTQYCKFTLTSLFLALITFQLEAQKPPVANPDSAVTSEGGSTSVLDDGATSVLANDTDTDQDTLSVVNTGINATDNGTVNLLADGQFTYTHDGSETTSDFFVYSVTDGSDVRAATVNISIAPVNDPPIVLDDIATVDEGGTFSSITSVLANDTDVDGPSALTVLTTATSPNSIATTNGSVQISADGFFTYSHNGSETTSDFFDYTISDGTGARTGRVNITIIPVSDSPPVANPDSATVFEGGSTSVLDNGATSVLANDTDAPDNSPLSVVNTGVNATDHGTVSLLANGEFTYTHDGGAATSDFFVYSVTDGTDVRAATVTIIINSVPIFVKSDATGLNDGSSWANAFKYLQDALSVAVDGDEIWVAKGTYRPDEGQTQTLGDRLASFQLKNGVKLLGGFIGSETVAEVRDPVANETILSGDLNEDDNDIIDENEPSRSENSVHVLEAIDTNLSAVMDGFTIQGGNANGTASNGQGGGLYCESAELTMSECIVLKNTAGQGGGFYLRGCSAVFSETVFENNSRQGVHTNLGGRPTFSHCKFIENTSAGAVLHGSAVFKDSIFFRNIGNAEGGAVQVGTNIDSEFHNCLFVENAATTKGGGLFLRSSINNSLIVNCVFFKNTAPRGGGISSVEPTITNSIFWGNTATIDGDQLNLDGLDGVPLPGVTYSLVEGGHPGTGNIDSDPSFLFDPLPAGLDGVYGTDDDGLQLQLNSPALDAGTNDPVTTSEDFLGNQRILDGTVDLGAYEGCVLSLDGDSDGLLDAWEFQHFDNFDQTATGDFDDDDLDNLSEFQEGTNPTRRDSDFDDLTDGEEVNIHNTDPNEPHSDTDIFPDGYEVSNGLDPLFDDSLLDLDNDGFSNQLEFLYGTDPDDDTVFPLLTLDIHEAVELEWSTVTGVLYQIQESTDLETWVDLGDPIPGDGATMSAFISIVGESENFFRIVVVE